MLWLGGAVVAVILGGFACRVWQVRENQPITALEVELVGADYRFQFRYPGADGVLHTSDDRMGSGNLFLPEHASVRLRLTSQDKIYSFEIPARGISTGRARPGSGNEV